MTEADRFSPGEAAIIRNLIEKHFDLSESSKDPRVLILLAMKLIDNLKKNPLQEMEKVLQSLNAQARLVAWPTKLALNVAEGDLHSKIPTLDPDKDYPYFLYIAFEEAEFDWAMTQLETNPQANFENLAQTGFPYPKRGSDLARELNAPNN
jgi:hypothetical protein